MTGGRAGIALGLLWVALAGGCGDRGEAVGESSPRAAGLARPAATSAAAFTRVTEAAGVRFRHEDGASGRRYFAESMGAGVAFADLTGDGRPDIYLVNGARLPGAPAGAPIRDAFYVNQGDGTFVDRTDAAALGDPGYGMGCCVGDYDADGNPDLFVTNVGRCTLYRNRGAGVFSDVTAAAGVGLKGFCTGAAFGDADGDGDLDLYVCRYVKWSAATDQPCHAQQGDRQVEVYCRPTVYPADLGVLYLNDGSGRFRDATRAAGLAVPPGRSLGCLWTDFDNDGDMDLFVANDMSPNFLFVNDGKGHFREEAMARGVALGEGGKTHAGMGVAASDFDGDGWMDLAVTNFSGEYLALYRNLGGNAFEDVSARAGLVRATNRFVGFGLCFADLDLNGWPDLFVANGHVTEAAEQFYPGVTMAQPNLCLLQNSAGGFDALVNPGEGVTQARASRGLAVADFDGDGDPDLLVNNWKEAPDLLRNDLPRRGRWLRLRLLGSGKNRAALGARVRVTAAGRSQTQEVRSGGSYASQSDGALTFGLGDATSARVEVTWPGRRAAEVWEPLAGDREHQLRPGGAKEGAR